MAHADARDAAANAILKRVEEWAAKPSANPDSTLKLARIYALVVHGKD